MIIALSIVLYVVEILMITYLVNKIIKHHKISLKDTIVYPFIFLLCFFIVIIGYMRFGATSFIDALPKGVTDAINVVKLSLDNNFINLAKNGGIEGFFLLVSYYAVYFLSFFALISLSIVLFIAAFKNVLRLFVIFFRKEINIVFGLNEDGKTFVSNLERKERKRTIVVLDSSKIDKHTDERLFLDQKKVAFISKPYATEKDVYNSLNKIIKCKTKKYNIISFISEDDLNQAFVLASRKYLDHINAYGGYYYSQENVSFLHPNKIYCLKIKGTKLEAIIDGAEIIDSSINSGIWVFKAKDQDVKIEFVQPKTIDNKKLIPYTINKNLFNNSNSKKELKIIIKNEENISFTINELTYKEQANVEIIINTSKNQKTFINDFIENYNLPFCDCRSRFLNEKWEEVENIDRSQGLIRTFNKYDLIAYDFICNHDLAKHFPKELINGDCTIEECDVNLYVFGFGKVNQALLRDCLINTSFVKKVKDGNGYKLVPVRINVKVYDKKSKNDDLETSLGFIKYDKKSHDENNFLPLVDNYLDIDCFKFNTPIDQFNIIDGIYNDIKNRIYNNDVPQVNYFLVSFDTDYANWNLANKLNKHLANINRCHNYFFFRTQDKLTVANNENFINYGIEISRDKDTKVVLSYDNVVKDKVYELARSRHFMYLNKDVNFEISDNLKNSNKTIVSPEALRCSWAQLSYFKKMSNLYAIASINFKLSLMKLNDINDYETKYLINDTKYSYDKFIHEKEKYSCREVLTFMEHERWNAFEIANGALPLRIDKAIQLTNDSGRFTTQIGHLYHLCITTAEGLVKYYELANNKDAFKNGLTFPDAADVVKYDYDLMDYFLKHQEMLDLYK